jgi:hypothetical protein
VRAPTAVAPIRQSRTRPAVAAPLRPSPQWGSTQQASASAGRVLVVCLVRPKGNDVFHATRQPFDPGSPTAGCAPSRWSESYVEELWSPSLAHGSANGQAKADAYRLAHLQRGYAEGLSLSGGASIRSRASQAEHHLGFRR